MQLWATNKIEDGRLAAGGPIPRYGSAGWEMLDDADEVAGRIKRASVVIAAEAARTDSTPSELALRFGIELREVARVNAELDAEPDRQLAERVRRLSDSPSYAELQRRRAGGAS